MAGYKESLDSLRLLNHPHIKPGLHYRALKDANQSLWLPSASLALAVASFSGSGCGQPLWLRSCHFWLCSTQQLPKPFLTSPKPNGSFPF